MIEGIPESKNNSSRVSSKYLVGFLEGISRAESFGCSMSVASGSCSGSTVFGSGKVSVGKSSIDKVGGVSIRGVGGVSIRGISVETSSLFVKS